MDYGTVSPALSYCRRTCTREANTLNTSCLHSDKESQPLFSIAPSCCVGRHTTRGRCRRVWWQVAVDRETQTRGRSAAWLGVSTVCEATWFSDKSNHIVASHILPSPHTQQLPPNNGTMAIREGPWQSKNDHDFILRSLRGGRRADGRQLGDMRLLRMVFARSEGQASAEIQLGRTRVLGVVTGEVRVAVLSAVL